MVVAEALKNSVGVPLVPQLEEGCCQGGAPGKTHLPQGCAAFLIAAEHESWHLVSSPASEDSSHAAPNAQEFMLSVIILQNHLNYA